MSNVDPFGRKKGENPLASLGWLDSDSDNDEAGGEAEPQIQLGRDPEPVHEQERESRRESDRDAERQAERVAQAQAQAEQIAARFRRATPTDDDGSPSPLRVGRLVRRLVLLGVVVAVVVGPAVGLLTTGAEKADRFIDSLTTPATPAVETPARIGGEAEQPAAPEQPAPPERAPTGVGQGSLLRPYAFGRAIAQLRTGGYGRLTNLRVAPERIDATLLTTQGRLRIMQLTPGNAPRTISTTGSGFASAPTMSLKGINAGAPARLTKAAAERLNKPASRVNYLVYSEFAGTPQWNVYFKAGEIFSADAQGRITRRVS